MKFISFNHFKWLEQNNIPYRTKGKNVSQGWTGVNCPFCSYDSSFHCGINNYSKKFSCWKCGEKGNIIKLIKRLQNFSTSEAYAIVQQFSSAYVSVDFPQKETTKVTKCELPSNTISKPLKQHALWLLKRKFKPTQLHKQYNFFYTRVSSKWNWRIIAPYFHNKQLLTYMGVDVTAQQIPKYKQCSIENSIIDPKRTLYNLPNHRNTVLVVEGLTDVWRMGTNTVAVTGVKYTSEQVNLLSEFKRVFIMFDADQAGYENSISLANTLSNFVPSVEIIELESGDPADLSERDVLAIRNDVFGNLQA